ncbi:MAG: glycine cleavage system protein GcvH [Fimbriimonas sp.]|jgi:glycine cleavage system H protein|nr:glycine cleavage system protein GcvH [Fimbriimonas sp.]
MSNIPADLKYTESHEWVRVDGDVATIGITDHAQSELGDVVYVDLPTVGKSLAIGETFGSVESVKTVSDLYAPVAGEVIEVNGELASASELVNSDPYGQGFMIKIRLSGDVPGTLLDAAGYGAVAH